MARFLTILLCAALPVAAEPVNITPETQSVTVQTAKGSQEISRIQDTTHEVTGEWARTSRPCPPFCIQPMSPADGVKTVGELEVLEALQAPDVVVIDSRTPDWFQGGTIPGAINIPYTDIIDRLGALGCEPDFDGWICDDAQNVLLFCNGLWCGQSPTAINNMIEAGYPPEKISYYRGGMQSWRVLGLTVTGDD